MYDKLTGDQVTSVHKLYKFLRKLRVLGLMNTLTKRVYITEMGKPIRYKLIFISYDPAYKGKNSPEENLDQFFLSRDSW
jgi:hypothetical protein